jgi:N-acetyl-anhydromuramyl-L-alanine amidase AmpD
MSFEVALKAALSVYAPGKVVYVKGWQTRNTGAWRTRSKKPVMTFMHHTAGSATTSQDPKNKGNKKGANAGVVAYCVAAKNSVPYCNAVVDRDGTIYVLAAGPVWHAGEGSFKGTRWAWLRIPDDSANGATFGVEIVSKGLKQDFTAAQMQSVEDLNCAVRKAAGWRGFRFRIANHKDWAPKRKIDTRYPWETFVEGAKKAWRKTR